LQGTFCSLLRAGLHLFQNENDEQPAKLKLESSTEEFPPWNIISTKSVRTGFIGSLKTGLIYFFENLDFFEKTEN
jgi:hypothetical protein